MTSNLVQHRGQPSVWDRTSSRPAWDTERWVVAGLSGGLLVAGFRRRSVGGLMLILAGASLAWWAATGPDERRVHRGRIRAAWPTRTRDVDCVHEAAEESFPASDAPSWTPTMGNAGPAHASRLH